MESCLEHEINIHLTNVYLAPAVCQTVLRGKDTLVGGKKKTKTQSRNLHPCGSCFFAGGETESQGMNK